MRLAAFAPLLLACAPPGYHSGSGTSADAPAATVDAGSAVTAGSDAMTAGSGTCAETFQLYGYGGSTSVWVSGDFVQWATNPGSGALAMTLGSDGSWAVEHSFATGTYQYKLIINGSTWIADPDDANVVDDGEGGYNSVYVCN
ncbi:MAG TPA: glycogen-binding domain-containing protein [Kofleriaceae bacterium]|nr:glycogen-binding domain-containing protein [Kofleriaceae bacterium]